MSFVRDRIVEVYFWMNGACYDPPYSRSRIILTKITSLVTIIDDMFDTYGTTEDCTKFHEAIGRYICITIFQNTPTHERMPDEFIYFKKYYGY